ncbi:uncharacterized protein LOC127060193 [Serinus canaria]|uniref:uncharacterized protein LOC127060193 n=1 Tax=Serinus canaria TaxID=9135 RepID=UPI0021CCCACC|nr:uncharacterized protein LOC127060193 [Serinus canaria]
MSQPPVLGTEQPRCCHGKIQGLKGKIQNGPRGTWEGAEARSTLNGEGKPGLVPGFATGCWHSGVFRQCHSQAMPFPGSAIPGQCHPRAVASAGNSIPGQCHSRAVAFPGSAIPGQCHSQAVPFPGSGIPRQCYSQAVPSLGSAIPRQCHSWPVPFPGSAIPGQCHSQALSWGSSIPGRFLHPCRPSSGCAAAPGQAEELLVPSSCQGTGRDSSWILWGSPSHPFGAILAHRDTESSLAQPRAGPEASGKPRGLVSSLCRKTKRQECPDQPALPGARESCGGRRMRRKGWRRVPGISWSLPGHLHLHTSWLQVLTWPILGISRDIPALRALPASLLALPPRGTRGLLAGTECCIYFPPPALLQPGSAWARQNSTLDGKLLAQEWRVRSPEPQGP